MSDRQTHWNAAYNARDEDRLTWFESESGLSDHLLETHGDVSQGVLVVGAGMSRLPDRLVAGGARDISILDVSDQAVARVVARIGADRVTGIVADLTDWKPDRRYGVWQDRAVFHFLTDEAGQAAYLEAMADAVLPGGLAVIATFSLRGPEKCSNLPVQRYSEETLLARVQESCGGMFDLIEAREQDHVTPMGNVQPFTFVALRRVA